MPYIRGSYAAGKLSIGFWDHWVPGANAEIQSLVEEWAAREKVDVQIDFITSQGNKLLLTTQAEAQAKLGHDILALPTWRAADHATLLEPVDEIMGPLIKQNGTVNTTVEYLGKSDGHWIAVPTAFGSQIKGPCSRIDLMKQHAGIDVQAMYPAGAPPKAESWTLDMFLKAAEACHKAGFRNRFACFCSVLSEDIVRLRCRKTAKAYCRSRMKLSGNALTGIDTRIFGAVGDRFGERGRKFTKLDRDYSDLVRHSRGGHLLGRAYH
jgi:hypothetical protein